MEPTDTALLKCGCAQHDFCDENVCWPKSLFGLELSLKNTTCQNPTNTGALGFARPVRGRFGSQNRYLAWSFPQKYRTVPVKPGWCALLLPLEAFLEKLLRTTAVVVPIRNYLISNQVSAMACVGDSHPLILCGFWAPQSSMPSPPGRVGPWFCPAVRPFSSPLSVLLT